MFSKSKISKVFAVAALTLAGSSAVFAEAPTSFVHNGTTYTYVQTTEKGKRVISGRSSDGQTFRLLVGERNVTGRFNGSLVTFSLRDVPSAQVAMR